MKIGVLGAGSWGIALTVLLSGNNHDVTVWSIDANEIEMLNTYREHKTKLAGVMVDEKVVFTTDVELACKGAELLVMVVPSPFIRSTAKRIAPYVTKEQIIVNVSKRLKFLAAYVIISVTFKVNKYQIAINPLLKTVCGVKKGEK